MEEVEKISMVTNNDYIQIVSTFTAMTDKSFDCNVCKKQYSKSPERQKNYQYKKGCDGSFNPNFLYRPDNPNSGRPKVKYSKCIGNIYSQSTAALINYRPIFEKGVLPYEGSYFEQPNKFIEIMDLVGSLDFDRQEAMAKRNKRYGKRS